MEDYLIKYINNQTTNLTALPLYQIENIIRLLQAAINEGKRIFVCGNGGSGANASHFATDLGKSVSDHLDTKVKVLSLNDNTPYITAIGNDYSFDKIFTHQLHNFAEEGDILFCLSVSGSSPNIINVARAANAKNMFVVSLVGEKGAALSGLSDYSIMVQDNHYGRVEDVEMTILHMICYYFIEKL